MRISKPTAVLCLCVLLNGSVSAKPAHHPEVIVTATKFATPIDQLSERVQVISGEDIQSLGVLSVKEALGLLTNLSVVSAGGQNSIFMNGLGSNSYQILVDGIPLKDATATQGAPFLDSLLLNNIDRIEIISGDKSALYGSGAIAGVIHIITKQSSDTSVHYDLNGGRDRYQAQFSYATPIQTARFQLDVARQYDYSRTALLKSSEKDKSVIDNIHVAFEQPIKGVQLKLNVHHNRNEIDLDSPPVTDDPNFHINNQQTLIGLGTSFSPKDNWNSKANYSLTFTDRTSLNPTDNIDLTAFDDSNYSSTVGRLEWINQFQPQVQYGKLDITAGLDRTHEDARIKNITNFGSSSLQKSQAMTGAFSEARWNNHFLSAWLGGRYERYSTSKSHVPLSGGIGYNLTNTIKAWGSIKTGFREPSLFELFSSFGNPNLTAQESKTQELGIQKNWQKSEAKISYFANDTTNKIDFVSSAYANVAGKTTLDGMNYELAFYPNDTVKRISIGYTHTNLGTQQRIPRDKVNLLSTLRLGKGTLGVSAIYVGERLDFDNTTFGTTTLATYTVVNAKFQYPVFHDTHAYLSAQNIFGANYMEVSDYATPGRTLLIGIQR